MILVKQAPCGNTSEGHLVFLLLKLNMKKGLTFGEKTTDYELWVHAKQPQGAEWKTKGCREDHFTKEEAKGTVSVS